MALEELIIDMFLVIKMAVNRKGGLYVHGTKFMNQFCYIVIKFYAGNHMKSNCNNLTHSRITYFMHA